MASMSTMKTENKDMIDRIAARFVWVGVVMMAIPALITVYWAQDRKPPFELVSFEPVVVVAGESLALHAKVRRDVERNCATRFSRYTINSNNQKSNESVMTYMNADSVADMNRIMGDGVLNLQYPISDDMPAGQAIFITSLDYMCNPLQAVWPIQVVMKVPFTVLPRNPKELK